LPLESRSRSGGYTHAERRSCPNVNRLVSGFSEKCGA
jgi:hypothetical protein